jgi:hypothetical protein
MLLDHFKDQEMLAAIINSEGLCFLHLRQSCKHVQGGVVLAELLKVELGKPENLHASLAEFIHKNDHQYLKDGFGKEGNAWRLAADLEASGRVEPYKTGRDRKVTDK